MNGAALSQDGAEDGAEDGGNGGDTPEARQSGASVGTTPTEEMI